jgi:hypothetical protein
VHSPQPALAQLLHQAEMLRIEVEPLAESLRRCDEIQAHVDRALAHRDRLLEDYDRAPATSFVTTTEASLSSSGAFAFVAIARMPASRP